MIPVSDSFSLDERTLHFRAIRASGPGGQNVNKVATAVQLRFDTRAAGLPAAVSARLAKLAGTRLNLGGVLVIDARRFRSQQRNREDAVDRLVALLRAALHVPKSRRPTRPSAAARQRRLDEKRRRGTLKRRRGGRVDVSD